MNFIRLFIIIVLMTPMRGLSQNLATPDSLIDSTYVEKRAFPDNKIQSYKADPEFNYGTRPVPELSLWERFKLWISYLVSKLFYFGTETPWGKVLFYGIIIAILIYAGLKLLKIEPRSLFYSNAQSNKVQYNILDENIHELNFDSKIKEAKDNKNFKEAVRLIFLYALKSLTDKDLIGWEPGKTNHQYVEELQAHELRPYLGDLSFYFDYACYGDFPVTENIMERVDKTFDDLKIKINIRKGVK